MPEATIWRRSNGILELEWPEGVHSIEITREALESLVMTANLQSDLRAALDRFLLLDGRTFSSNEELLDEWNLACDNARLVLGLVTS